MAIDLHHWRAILRAKAKGRALSAGYPDLLVPANEIPAAPLQVRADSDEIAEHHGWKGPIYDSVQVFKMLGIELDVIDRKEHRGGESIVDLNEPSAAILLRARYDLVIDPGTSEHCFNIAQALVNLADAVKVGGAICQALPMSMFNHGYWNVNPVALLDFYETNGFEIERMVIRHAGGVFEPSPDERFARMLNVPENAVTLVTARRLEARAFRWPQQRG